MMLPAGNLRKPRTPPPPSNSKAVAPWGAAWLPSAERPLRRGLLLSSRGGVSRAKRTASAAAALRAAELGWNGFAVLALTYEERSVETRTAAAAIGISRRTLIEIAWTLIEIAWTLIEIARTLESKNLIRRVPPCRDGRLVLLEPTTTGWRLTRRLAPRATAAEDYAIGCLDGETRDALAGMLARLAADLD